MTAMPSETVPSLPSSVSSNLDFSSLVPLQAINPPHSTKQDKVVITFGRTVYNNFRAFFNSTSWDAEIGNATLFQTVDTQKQGTTTDVYDQDSQLVLTYDEVQVVDLIFNNQDDGTVSSKVVNCRH